MNPDKKTEPIVVVGQGDTRREFTGSEPTLALLGVCGWLAIALVAGMLSLVRIR